MLLKYRDQFEQIPYQTLSQKVKYNKSIKYLKISQSTITKKKKIKNPKLETLKRTERNKDKKKSYLQKWKSRNSTKKLVGASAAHKDQIKQINQQNSKTYLRKQVLERENGERERGAFKGLKQRS